MANKGKENKGKGKGGKVIEGVHMPGKEVEERLLEAGSPEELDEIHKILRAEAVPDGTITATITKLRKKGKLIFQTALIEAEGPTKPLPVEAIIKDLKLPTIADGGREIFDAGVSYATRMIVGGVRLAQELSRMGIAQASPIIRMASEMRKAEGLSAQEAGQVAAENALAGAMQYMSQQKADIATVPNPMMGIMARAMEPALTQVMGNMFGMFGRQPQQGQAQQPQAQQPQGSTQLPAGWSDESQKGKSEQTK